MVEIGAHPGIFRQSPPLGKDNRATPEVDFRLAQKRESPRATIRNQQAAI
jgi:hypothetical protein